MLNTLNYSLEIYVSCINRHAHTRQSFMNPMKKCKLIHQFNNNNNNNDEIINANLTTNQKK